MMTPPEMAKRKPVGLIVITRLCQNNCLFCGINGVPKAISRHRPLTEIFSQIQDIASHGAKKIIFTGGEPTGHPDVVDIIREARSHNFEDITLFTQGRNLSKHNLLERMIEAGLTGLMISLFGPNAEIHDESAQSQGAFRETIRGIRQASQTDLNLVINTPVTSLNYTVLDDILDIINTLSSPETCWQLSDLYPTTAVLENTSLHAPYAGVKSALDRALTKGMIASRKCVAQEFPLCILFPWLSEAKELQKKWQVKFFLGDEKNPFGSRKALPFTTPDRFFPEACSFCGYKGTCLGVPKSYFDQYHEVDAIKAI